MKKSKLFAKIIYYLFTFALGLLLAFSLPAYFIMYELPRTETQKYLLQGEYAKAIELVGGYYYSEPVMQRDLQNHEGGIVLFAAVVPMSVTNEDGEVIATKLHKSYAGYLYGVNGTYNVAGEENNSTNLRITTADGQIKDFDILSRTGTLSNDFCYLDVGQTNYPSIKLLEFIDADGAVFESIDCSNNSIPLDFSQQFFADVDDFLNEYNRDDMVTEEDRAKQKERLTRLGDEFQAKDVKYAKSSYGDLQKIADLKSVPIVIAYFVVIYIIADFLVGRHFIIRFFKWVYSKTPRGKAKALKRAENKEAFGHDYYCQVTMSLDLSELPDFNESVQVRYANTDVEVNFILMKDNNYSVTERVKAGVYVNGWIDINRDYAPVNMPENLIVEGYKMDVKIKIIKRKEESV